MGSATWTRALLGVLAVAVAYLVVRDLQRGGSQRYVVTPLRPGSPVLIRMDTVSGQSWKLELRAGGGRWELLPEPGTPAWTAAVSAAPSLPGPEDLNAPPRPLARDEIKSLANAILGDELSHDIRIWAVGQLAVTEDRRATVALIQLLGEVDEPDLRALIREALEQRDDPRARQALERDQQPRAGNDL
jgi:hypothetical protein